jgi:hypothetical protein
VITLQLADVPFDADVANPQGRPLGTREQVAARFGELLPGTTFDGSGRGTFRRGAYQIAFMIYGDPPTSIGVAFDQADGFTPLMRVVEKTGWCLLDPEAKGFVDLAASRVAGRTVLVGEEVAESAASSPAPASTVAVSLSALGAKAAAAPRLLGAAAAGLALAAVAYAAAWYFTNGRVSVKLPATSLATQSSTVRFEKFSDRLVRRRDAMTRLPAPYASDRVVEQLIDAQLAARAYYNFVDGRYTSPELLSNESIWSRFQMPSFLPATFAQRQRDGYDFEFRGEGCEESEPGWPECVAYAYVARPVKAPETGGTVFALLSSDDKIHVRTDGKVPTRDDPTVDASPAQ